ncbi:MAG: hypothetical protein O3C34_15300 [Proteobacteria bacterium]|nr:hypothetical protein [Pseudomonadota bacterium]
MSALGDIQTQLEQTANVIEGFRCSVAEGSVVDLSGLDQSVEVMCTAINDLPAEQRVTVKATLIGLLDDLNTLVELLNMQQSEASEGLKGVASRQKAVSAYGKSINTTKSAKVDPAK